MYKNRIHAGEILLDEIIKRGLGENLSFLFAVPRGGVEIAYPIARVLRKVILPVIIHKIPASYNPELAIGAVSITGEVVLNELAEGETSDYVETAKKKTMVELKRREEVFGLKFDYSIVRKKNILIVDDGIATGETLFLAAKTLKVLNPAKLYVAVPVASLDGYEKLKQLGEVVCPIVDRYFYAVSPYYDEFPQLGEETVRKYIQESAKFTE